MPWIWGFPKIGVPYWDPYCRGILLSILGVPCFRKPPVLTPAHNCNSIHRDQRSRSLSEADISPKVIRCEMTRGPGVLGCPPAAGCLRRAGSSWLLLSYLGHASLQHKSANDQSRRKPSFAWLRCNRAFSASVPDMNIAASCAP